MFLWTRYVSLPQVMPRSENLPDTRSLGLVRRVIIKGTEGHVRLNGVDDMLARRVRHFDGENLVMWVLVAEFAREGRPSQELHCRADKASCGCQ
jgi:hypothetical protein